MTAKSTKVSLKRHSTEQQNATATTIDDSTPLIMQENLNSSRDQPTMGAKHAAKPHMNLAEEHSPLVGPLKGTGDRRNEKDAPSFFRTPEKHRSPKRVKKVSNGETLRVQANMKKDSDFNTGAKYRSVISVERLRNSETRFNSTQSPDTSYQKTTYSKNRGGNQPASCAKKRIEAQRSQKLVGGDLLLKKLGNGSQQPLATVDPMETPITSLDERLTRVEKKIGFYHKYLKGSVDDISPSVQIEIDIARENHKEFERFVRDKFAEEYNISTVTTRCESLTETCTGLAATTTKTNEGLTSLKEGVRSVEATMISQKASQDLINDNLSIDFLEAKSKLADTNQRIAEDILPRLRGFDGLVERIQKLENETKTSLTEDVLLRLRASDGVVESIHNLELELSSLRQTAERLEANVPELITDLALGDICKLQSQVTEIQESLDKRTPPQVTDPAIDQLKKLVEQQDKTIKSLTSGNATLTVNYKSLVNDNRALQVDNEARRNEIAAMNRRFNERIHKLEASRTELHRGDVATEVGRVLENVFTVNHLEQKAILSNHRGRLEALERMNVEGVKALVDSKSKEMGSQLKKEITSVQNHFAQSVLDTQELVSIPCEPSSLNARINSVARAAIGPWLSLTGSAARNHQSPLSRPHSQQSMSPTATRANSHRVLGNLPHQQQVRMPQQQQQQQRQQQQHNVVSRQFQIPQQQQQQQQVQHEALTQAKILSGHSTSGPRQGAHAIQHPERTTARAHRSNDLSSPVYCYRQQPPGISLLAQGHQFPPQQHPLGPTSTTILFQHPRSTEKNISSRGMGYLYLTSKFPMPQNPPTVETHLHNNSLLFYEGLIGSVITCRSWEYLSLLTCISISSSTKPVIYFTRPKQTDRAVVDSGAWVESAGIPINSGVEISEVIVCNRSECESINPLRVAPRPIELTKPLTTSPPNIFRTNNKTAP
ncbi:uncharacterized protein BDR25DRAFT_363299 [Lindgomyces ingoldianus]|uniref:Uncharacterized protein n=1 Tax=Lindgomyces ingoldianus TaxID=673940 RepID=A0ACB6Q8P1_9PLEO|nr:uncharacterized protein BDR25DRAFT_363299 [Lindgomyces ingoldianus]KAF2462968.1 hypothetical protein BDR25DRAFT_363299 [Lindgomyces ingoldianus]